MQSTDAIAQENDPDDKRFEDGVTIRHRGIVIIGLYGIQTMEAVRESAEHH